ncbi:phage antirepressor N-terminal domain-containing protein [Streptomyces sp. NPDC046979]|uniref:phage antirepressor N-terminal domain-containing protein n=1 Tax=Streptomyces sp. NPDC046979 TaxID=3154604 RepID=UPI003409076A
MNEIAIRPATITLSAGSLLTLMHEGQECVVIRPAVESLGMSYAAQYRKLKTRSWACVAQKAMQLPGDIQSRSHDVVPVRTFLMWLATVNENKVAPEVRPVLIAFQNETADAIEAYWTKGQAVNPRRVDRAVDELQVVRELEIRDYRRIRHAIWEAGGDREDFRDARNAIYEVLFGMPAAAIRRTRPQIGGERYVKDYRNPRTGTLHKAGELRPSDATPDYLTRDEIQRLDNAVLWITSTLSLRHPEGYASLNDILKVLQAFAAQARPALPKREPAAVASSDFRGRLDTLRFKLGLEGAR